jgi:TM2 domain-containing membrane protein YozV
MPNPKVDLKNRHLALLLAWMVPGLGHFYQGRIGKAILYSVSILSLFIVGLAMGNWKIVYWRWVNPTANTESFCFNYLGQFWAGLIALPALLQSTSFVKDHGPILWGFMAEPAQRELNGLYPTLGKFVEIGTLYTTVAGLLNILAMYDAFEGPAHADEDQATPADDPKTLTKGIEVGASA